MNNRRLLAVVLKSHTCRVFTMWKTLKTLVCAEPRAEVMNTRMWKEKLPKLARIWCLAQS